MFSRPSRRTVWDNGNKQVIKKEQKWGFERCWEFNSYIYSACVQRRYPCWAQGVQQASQPADAQFGHSTRRRKSRCLCKIFIEFLNKSTLQPLLCPKYQNSLDIQHCLQTIHLHVVHIRNVFPKYLLLIHDHTLVFNGLRWKLWCAS
jgi:hypothetical protein